MDISRDAFPEFEEKFRKFLLEEFGVEGIPKIHMLCLEGKKELHVIIDCFCTECTDKSKMAAFLQTLVGEHADSISSPEHP